jgi:hypothetical protein
LSAKSILKAVFGKFSHFYTKFGKIIPKETKNKKRAYFKLNKKEGKDGFQERKNCKVGKIRKSIRKERKIKHGKIYK